MEISLVLSRGKSSTINISHCCMVYTSLQIWLFSSNGMLATRACLHLSNNNRWLLQCMVHMRYWL